MPSQASRSPHVRLTVHFFRDIHMNRKTFIQAHDATCKSWRSSWAFVNHDKNFVIFGAWDAKAHDSENLILSSSWEYQPNGRKQGQYSEAREYIRLVQEEGYSLYTFPMTFSDEHQDAEGNGPARISSFEPTLLRRYLQQRDDGDWYAVASETDFLYPEEIGDKETYVEGAKTTILVNSYERNAEAREKCLLTHGFRCQVCDMNFEDLYGEIGKNYIHVHHTTPISSIGKEYEVNPVTDLVPVCPNCHAMLHKKHPPIEVKTLREIMASRKKGRGL
jgi:5-methylcytosine-specific restriction protein A